jgi:cell wall-associated NlpC family hydrolase
MRENQLRRSVLPMSALITAGALVLSGSPATASSAATSGTSATDDPVQIAATATESDAETVSQHRTVTVVVHRQLTSKVKADGWATNGATASSTASSSATVTGYAATKAEALVVARNLAEQTAHARAVKAAKDRAGKLALTRAKALAYPRARVRANNNVRRRFGTVVLGKAAAQRGKPYRWGASGPRAFDCSGLVGYVMRGAGVKGLPRTSSAMASKAHRVAKANKKPGDLVFFTSGGHVYHVAIYAGNGMIWHAPGSGQHVEKIRIWTSSYRVGRLPV